MSEERARTPLERTLSRAFAELPARHAPRELAEEVLQRIAQRRSARGFAHWSVRTRAAFLGACGAALAGMLALRPELLHGLLMPLPDAQPLLALWRAAEIVRDSVPANVLQKTLLLGALFYAAFFGLTATGYRLYTGAARREELPHA